MFTGTPVPAVGVALAEALGVAVAVSLGVALAVADALGDAVLLCHGNGDAEPPLQSGRASADFPAAGRRSRGR
jgi:hypothetical protein